MKQLLLILMLLSLGYCDMLAQDAILVSLSDGRSQVFMLDSNPKVKYDGNNVVISSDDAELYVETDDGIVAKVVFQDTEETSVKNVEQGEKAKPCFHIVGKTILVSGVDASSMVQAYDLKGVMVASENADEEGNATLELKMRGVYIVKTKSITFRILIK